MTPTEHEAALLGALAELAGLLEAGDPEAAVAAMERAAALCGAGAPALSAAGAADARGRFARCLEANAKLGATLREAMSSLGHSSRAHDAYRK